MNPPFDSDLEPLGINVVRGLAMDAPHAASSGHQGTAMALAPLAHVLYTRVMKYDAAAPQWFDRDRFVLSAGHASILQYSFLHLTGHGLSLDDIRAFRQWNSATPGHPEAGHTAGVEVTTGPLGQGIGNAVGMAMAERWMRAEFGAEICDHNVWAICGDGDLAEGLSHEAASLAGHLGLGRLVCVYDDNHISIDGPTEEWLVDDAAARFTSYGWQVIDLGESAEDLDRIEQALIDARAEQDRPSLVIVRSHIGHPSPTLTGSPSAHGYAFKDEEITAAKTAMGLPDEPFHVPADVLDAYRSAGTRHHDQRVAWQSRLDSLDASTRSRFDTCLAGAAEGDWTESLPTFNSGDSIATRKASNTCLDAVAPHVPGLVAGSADLTGNTGVKLAGADPMTAAQPGGRQVRYGVREHAMAAAMNGMAMHGGVVPVGGTFLVFSDYCRPSIRLAALMGSKVIYSFTHDSVGVGEDGPTHQPVEHVASLRLIPDLQVIRPADATEVAEAWKLAIAHDGPTALILTRQGVPVLDGTGDGVNRGAYPVIEADNSALTLIGAGSEVHLCVAAAEALTAEGVVTRVVSFPCEDRFAAQDASYRAATLGSGPVLAVEAGVGSGWYQWADDVVSIDRFGASAPGPTVLREFGMSADNIADRARALLADTSP